jgi:hypothetical protein
LKACFDFLRSIKACFILKCQDHSRLSYGAASASIRYPIARLLIESVVVSADAVSIAWRDAGRAELAREVRPDGIGAELLELEAEGADA